MPMGSKILTFIERTKTTDIYQNVGWHIPLTNSDWFGKCLCTGSPGSKEEAEKQALWIRPLDDAVSHWLSNWQKITSCGLKWIYSLSSTHPTRNCYNKTHSPWKINGFWWRIPIILLSPLCLTSSLPLASPQWLYIHSHPLIHPYSTASRQDHPWDTKLKEPPW